MLRPSRVAVAGMGDGRSAVPIALVCVPLILVTFRSTLLPRAADWSRDRAIQHSATLIAELEAFRARRGHYPVYDGEELDRRRGDRRRTPLAQPHWISILFD